MALESERQTKLVESPSEDVGADGTPKEYITLQEVAKHSFAQDTWVILNGKVYE